MCTFSKVRGYSQFLGLVMRTSQNAPNFLLKKKKIPLRLTRITYEFRNQDLAF